MSPIIIGTVLQYTGYAFMSFAVLRLASILKYNGKVEEDVGPELNEIVQKPRLRR